MALEAGTINLSGKTRARIAERLQFVASRPWAHYGSGAVDPIKLRADRHDVDSWEGTQALLEALKEVCRQTRVTTIKAIHKAGSGHPAGSFSATEILVALYYGKLRLRPGEPSWPERDRFVLSKGHGCPALYTVLAQFGYFDPDELNRLRKVGGILEGHCHSGMTPGVEVCTGSLGHGLAQSVGIALGLRLDGRPSRVYCLISDGECQEGSTWEAAMSAAHYKLENLTGILDFNGVQLDGYVKETIDLDPLPDKWRAHRWAVREVDGHDIAQVLGALEWAEGVKGNPAMIVAHTVKGKGVDFMENTPKWHGVAPNDQELAEALRQLGEA